MARYGLSLFVVVWYSWSVIYHTSNTHDKDAMLHYTVCLKTNKQPNKQTSKKQTNKQTKNTFLLTIIELHRQISFTLLHLIKNAIKMYISVTKQKTLVS